MNFFLLIVNFLGILSYNYQVLTSFSTPDYFNFSNRDFLKVSS